MFLASLHGLKKGGVGAAQPPPICKHSARMMGFQEGRICFESSLRGL